MLDTLKKKREDTQAAAAKLYRKLVTKLGRSGALSPSEESQLDEAARTVARSLEDAEHDARIIATAAALEVEADKLPGATAATAQAQATLEAHNAETLRLLQERDTTAGGIIGQIHAAQAAEQAARTAAEKLRELRGKHWQLLAAEDPVRLAQRRYLRLGPGPAIPGDIPVVDIRVFLGEDRPRMAEPTLPARNAFEVLWQLLPGQTEAELYDLVGLLQHAISSRAMTGKSVRFLADLGPNAPLQQIGDYTINVGVDKHFLPSRVMFIVARRPSQTPEEFSELLAKFEAGTQAERQGYSNVPITVLRWEPWQPTTGTGGPQ